MRTKNSTMIIGSVKLKSKSAAFSISSAKEGGVKVNEVAAMRERDLRVEVERDRSWGLVILRSLGKEICGAWSLGLELVGREVDERVRRGLAVPMIMLAMLMTKFGVVESFGV